jgi:hypothetical protein
MVTKKNYLKKLFLLSGTYGGGGGDKIIALNWDSCDKI